MMVAVVRRPAHVDPVGRFSSGKPIWLCPICVRGLNLRGFPLPCSLIPLCTSSLQAFEVVLHHEVHNTGHGVRAVDRRGAAGEDVDVVD